jgi:hypothetical protein
MHQTKNLTILAFAALMVAVVFVWKKRDAVENGPRDDDGLMETVATQPKRGNPRGDAGHSPVADITEVKPLVLPPGSLPTIEKEADATKCQNAINE